jgi:hypothetical protein
MRAPSALSETGGLFQFAVSGADRYNRAMTEIPETAATVVDYLKEQFAGNDVKDEPTYAAGPDMFSFLVVCQDKRYWLEVSDECLTDLSKSELEHHLRKTSAAEKMRSSATRTACLTKSGIAWGIPQKAT